MASAYVNIYQGTVTAGGKDGTVVSTDDAFTAPISFNLDASQNEAKTQMLAIRCETGYRYSNVTIQSTERYFFCKTSNGTFTPYITFSEITDTNTIFYIKAVSSVSDSPQIIRDIKLHCYGELGTV